MNTDRINVIEEEFIFPTRYLPECFTNNSIMDKLEIIFNNYNNATEMIETLFKVENGIIKSFLGVKDAIYGTAKGTESINFFMSKSNNRNRVMSVCNPLILLPLHKYIVENNEIILNEQIEDDEYIISGSKYFYDQDYILVKGVYDQDYNLIIDTEEKEYITKNDYKTNINISYKAINGKYFRMTIDISNFFNSIYSHMIAWDILNENDKNIFNNFDILNRSMNSNETKGIIIGPYTSALFSEIILSKIDRKIKDELVSKNISYYRFCDDYYIYSDSKEYLENEFKSLLENKLNIYKLDLNDAKTKVDEFPFTYSESEIRKKTTLLLNDINECDNEYEILDEIMNNLNMAFKSYYTNANYILKSISNPNIYDKLTVDTATILLDYLINLMFKCDLLSKNCCNIIIEIIHKFNINPELLILKWIFKWQNRKQQLKEITCIWLIYMINQFKIINEEINNFVIEIMNFSDLGAIIAIDYLYSTQQLTKYKKEIEKYLEKIDNELNTRFSSSKKASCYFSKYWLLFYTNSKKWKIHEIKGFKTTLFKTYNLNDAINSISLSKKLEIFKLLYDNDVDFFV